MLTASAGPNLTDQVRDLIRTAQDGGLPAAVLTLHRALSVEIGIFDLDGNTLAAAPDRTLWDYEQLLAARRGVDERLSVRTVRHQGEPAALLAAGTPDLPAAGAAARSNALLDIAVDVIAMEIARLRGRQEGRRELAATVLDDIIADRLSEQEAIAALRRIGVDGDRPLRVLLGWSRRSNPRASAIPWGLHALMGNRPDPLVRVMRGENVLMVVPDDPMVERIAHTLHQHMADLGASARVGVSLPHVGGSGLRAGYLEALTALREGTGVRVPKHVDLAKLLVISNKAMPLDEVARSVLEPLLEYDRTRGGSLVQTLREYLASNRIASEAADRLFVHRNTLRYRLRQIGELLEIDIESTRGIANLWLALTALGHLDEDELTSPQREVTE
ncbi:PucR family transcriptional regulator [Streptomyces sp. NPDC059460]|uniref:PucR family transcriptional regulator n=1 Tax=Streptomyces sp. NPDC059460 TaxID=3346840 RepID=UPI0036772586